MATVGVKGLKLGFGIGLPVCGCGSPSLAEILVHFIIAEPATEKLYVSSKMQQLFTVLASLLRRRLAANRTGRCMCQVHGAMMAFHPSVCLCPVHIIYSESESCKIQDMTLNTSNLWSKF